MTQVFDICIRGAGIVGRTLALHLASKRLRIALVDFAPTNPSADVRAYALNLPARSLLEQIECWPQEPFVTPVQTMQIWADEGGFVEFSSSQQNTDALSWIVDVPALENTLAQAVQRQSRIAVMSEPPDSATLTVVCEGRQSSSRKDWGLEFDVRPYPQWALAARVQSNTPHQQIARQWFAQGDILALLPIGGSSGSEYAVVWSTSPERASSLLADPTQDFELAINTASSGLACKLSLTSDRKIWPLQHGQAKRWTGQHADGAWVLAGDAAHNVHPLAGQGLNLGLGDVAELVRILENRPYWRSVGDARHLRDFERSRKAEFALMGLGNDILQQLFTAPNPLIQSVRNWGMNRFNHLPSLKSQIARRAMGST
jgi:2-polyprenyl-6-methoxyphenol hydroxylase-like FAD-dependent oxidoreductase